MKHTINNSKFSHPLIRGLDIPENLTLYRIIHQSYNPVQRIEVELSTIPCFCSIGQGKGRIRISNRIY